MMQRESLSAMRILAVCLAGAMATSFAMAQPAPLVLSSGELTGQNEDEAKTWLAEWAGTIAQAQDPSVVMTGGSTIRTTYNNLANSGSRFTFADLAATTLTPLLQDGLKSDDPLLQFKQINIAMTLAAMPKVKIVSALKVMMMHSNPGVRYLGWRGYLNARTMILSQGMNYLNGMISATKAAAATENSPAVINLIFRMCSPPSAAPGIIAPSNIQQANEAMKKIIEDNGPRWCRRILDSDAEMARTFLDGIKSVQAMALPSAGKAEKKQPLQLLMDLMNCASFAYDKYGDGGSFGQLNVKLLKRCETAIVTISGKKLNYVENALTSKEFESARGASVRRFALKWVDQLKAFGVTELKVSSTPKPAAPGT